MTDITAELAALPKMPTHIAACQHSQYGHLCSRIAMGTKIHALEVRLALAAWCLNLAVDGWTNDARAYLAHRAKEQP